MGGIEGVGDKEFVDIVGDVAGEELSLICVEYIFVLVDVRSFGSLESTS